jgi:hypothetical protein
MGRSHLRETSADYAGVIEQVRDCRLIVSARGGSYAVQVADTGGWRRIRSFPDAATLQAWLAVAMVDPPSNWLGVSRRLPRDPRQCPLRPYGGAAGGKSGSGAGVIAPRKEGRSAARKSSANAIPSGRR